MNEIMILEGKGSVPVTRETFSEDFTVSKCNDLYKNIRSVKEAQQTGSPSISNLVKAFDMAFVQAYIAAWIVNVNNFLNLRFSMNDQQVEETARLVINNYYHLTIADVYLVMNNAKMGFYGKFYERIDGSMVLLWFRTYFDERCAYFEGLSIDESNVLRSNISFNVKNRK